MNRDRGATSYHAGLAAEDCVARAYADLGATEIARRWRCGSGEIDLIVSQGDQIVFVEVKASKTHSRAAAALSPHQMRRIYNAAAEFLGTQPRGQLTPARFDLAVVDGTGDVRLMHGALNG